MYDSLKRKIGSALGEEQPSLVLKNAKVIDVFGHRVLECDVAVCDGCFVGLGEYSGDNIVDLNGQYLMPSFIDSHVHIESSMLSPAQYARLAAPRGVTALVCDPQQIANVCGEAGLRYMVDSSKSVPIDMYFMLPSCVPATGFDHAGAVIDSIATRRLFASGAFLGLGEMLSCRGVLERDPEVLQKIGCAILIDGHASGLSGRELCAYVAAGVLTDHECANPEELLERVSRGMYVAIQEGSRLKNISGVLDGVTPYVLRRLMFCTDCSNLHDFAIRGSVSNCIGEAVRLGMDPIDAITMASLNAAECYGLKKRGAVSPGYTADFVVSADIAAQDITMVYKSGVLIARDGQACFNAPDTADKKKVTGTVHLPEISAKLFELEFSPETPVIEFSAAADVTRLVHRNNDKGLNLCAVIERHGGAGEIGLAYAAGFDLRGGAVAQSIGHSSHNVTVAGDTPENMAIAVEALGSQGGMVIVRDGKVRDLFELPIAGLMSDKSAQEACIHYERFMETVRLLDINPKINPFTALAHISLLTLPQVRLGDKGVFDVERGKYLDS